MSQLGFIEKLLDLSGRQTASQTSTQTLQFGCHHLRGLSR